MDNNTNETPEISPEVYEFFGRLTLVTPKAYITSILIKINVIIFALMVITGTHILHPASNKLIQWGANFAPLTINGEWWRIFTCMFIHIGLIHILCNMWVLKDAGELVERLFGNIGFTILYVVSGLVGSLCGLHWHPFAVSAGASGAIFGVYGALLAYVLLGNQSIPKEILQSLRSSTVGFVLFNIVLGLSIPQISMAAHMGGLGAGFICGLILSLPLTAESLAKRKIRNAATISIGIVFVICGVLFFNQRGVEHPKLGKLFEYKEHQIFYTTPIQKKEVQKLADYLNKTEFLSGSPKSFMVKKSQQKYQFKMLIKKGYAQDKSLMEFCKQLAKGMETDVFKGSSVEIHLCEDNFDTVLNTIASGS